MLGVFYFLLNIYRMIDLCCDGYCLYYFDNPERKDIMQVTCVFGIVFNFCYLCRAIDITCSNGEINLPELNFNVIEVIINVIQTFLGGEIISSSIKKGCSDSMLMNFRFEVCCCFGSVLQLLCFFKNCCGCHGKKKQSDFDNIVNVIGLGGSLYTANVGFRSISDTFGKELPSCLG